MVADKGDFVHTAGDLPAGNRQHDVGKTLLRNRHVAMSHLLAVEVVDALERPELWLPVLYDDAISGRCRASRVDSPPQPLLADRLRGRARSHIGRAARHCEGDAVIGGLSRTVEDDVDSGIPFLRKLPWIGQKLYREGSALEVLKLDLRPLDKREDDENGDDDEGDDEETVAPDPGKVTITPAK